MKRTLVRRTAFLLCVALLLTPRPAKASIPTSGQIVGIGVAIAAIGAAIGVGIYFLVRRPPSITGCATTGSDGLILRNENDAYTYTLLGDTSAIKPGDRLRLTGKKKSDHPSEHKFIVDKVSKNYGACKLTTTL